MIDVGLGNQKRDCGCMLNAGYLNDVLGRGECVVELRAKVLLPLLENILQVGEDGGDLPLRNLCLLVQLAGHAREVCDVGYELLLPVVDVRQQLRHFQASLRALQRSEPIIRVESI